MRETEVLKLIAEAHSNREISEILHLSEKTIESHRGEHPAQARYAGPRRAGPLRDPPRARRALSRDRAGGAAAPAPPNLSGRDPSARAYRPDGRRDDRPACGRWRRCSRSTRARRPTRRRLRAARSGRPGPPVDFRLRDERGDPISPAAHSRAAAGRHVHVHDLQGRLPDDGAADPRRARRPRIRLGPGDRRQRRPGERHARARAAVHLRAGLRGRMHFALGDEAALQRGLAQVRDPAAGDAAASTPRGSCCSTLAAGSGSASRSTS